MGWEEIFKHSFFRGIIQSKNSSKKPRGVDYNSSDSSGDKIDIYKKVESYNDFYNEELT